MKGTMTYPRRLIEVDLPIGAVSQHARNARSVHRGHITAIHVWWARKPLPSCRAVSLAASLADPADPDCPESFRAQVRHTLTGIYGSNAGGTDHLSLRKELLRFVSDFASWERASDRTFLDAARTM